MVLKRLLFLLLTVSLLFAPVAMTTITATADEGHLVFPSALQSIEESAFSGDTSIISVDIPDNVQTIGQNAFSGCNNLSTVSFPNRDIDIAPGAFNGTTAVFKVYPFTYPMFYALIHGFQIELQAPVGGFSERAIDLVYDKGQPPESVLQSNDYASMRLLVQMSSNRLPDISEYNPETVLPEGNGFFVIQFSSIEDATNCASYIQGCEGIEYVEPDKFITANFVGGKEITAASLDSEYWSDTDPMGLQVYSDYLQRNYPNARAIVAVIDSGVGYHAAINGSVMQGYDATGEDNPRHDDAGHGTAVAGVIVDAAFGANVKILPVRVFTSDNSYVSRLQIRQAIQYAINSGANVINISSLFDESAAVKAMLRRSSVPVVVSAGNDNTSCDTLFPANVGGPVITVSALTGAMVRWSRSNYGSCVSYTAPGASILSYISGGGSGSFTGTSFAAPHIATAIALASMDPDPMHRASHLLDICTDLGATGKDPQYGYGLPDLSLWADKVRRINITSPIPSVMEVGSSTALVYEVLPDSAADKRVEITSSDSSVINATKAADGVVRLVALGKGTARVSIKALDGTETTVQTPEIHVVQPVITITLSSSANSNRINRAMEGASLSLISSVSPSTADNKGVVWSCEPESVATVGQNGVVYPVGDGTATITATAADGFGAYAEFEIEVYYQPSPDGIVIVPEEGKSTTINVGDSVRCYAEVYPEEAVQDVVWSVIPGNSATVTPINTTEGESTLFKATEKGTFYLIATSAVKSAVQMSIPIEVLQPPTSISISGPDTVCAGYSINLTAGVLPDNTSNKGVIWSCEPESIARVDGSGTVYGLKSGTAVITATCAGDETISARKTIRVIQLPATITITGDTSVYTGATAQLSATVLPEDADNKNVTWQSSNNSIATVSSGGLVTGVGEGTAIITVTAKAKSDVKATHTINVYPQWNAWSDWGTTAYTATNDMQVESKTQYRYRDQTQAESYGEWSAWGAWTKTRETITDSTVKEEQSATVYPWYYFYCSNCGKHSKQWGSDVKCSGCNKTGTVKEGSWTWRFTTKAWSGSTKVSYTETEYGYGLMWSWVDASGSNKTGTGYRYRTRTHTEQAWGNWSGWSDTKVTASSTRQVETRTVYRRRTKYVPGRYVSGWVLESQVPSGATIIDTKWTYDETTVSSSSSLSGWTQTGSSWKETGSGSVRKVDFSHTTGFDTGSSLYTKFNVTAPAAYEDSTSKRTVSTADDGYVYWHWMYDCGGANAGDRAIFYKKGTGSSTLTGNSYGYKYFGAFESTKNYTQMAANTNWGQNDTYYLWYKVTDRSSYSSSQGSLYWYRNKIMKYSYVDYSKVYTYKRTVETTTQPTASNTVSNIVKYVIYMTNNN